MSDMASSSSEISSGGFYFLDRLRTVRPYTESQLLQLHQNVQLEENDAFVDNFLRECRDADALPFQQNVADLKKWRDLYGKSRAKLLQLKDQNERLIETAWDTETRTIKKRSRCADSRLVEGKHTYKEAHLDQTKVKKLEENLQTLKCSLVNDYCNQFYMSLSTQQAIENEINCVIQEALGEVRHNKIKSLISCLFAVQRSVEDVDDDFLDLTRRWTTCLVSALLQNGTQSDCLFLLNHILRCPGGVSTWTSSFIQCKSPLHAQTESEAKGLLNHCLTVISTILSPVKDREKFVGRDTNTKPAKTSADDLWHLVDADIDEGEDVLVSKKNLTETDIIRFLQQVPFDGVILHISELRMLDDQATGSFRFGECSELSMLKLLAVATQIIQTLRQGLVTFNCLRFRTLTDYITSLIRKTVSAVSSFWDSCKTQVEPDDQALMLRLQVEYDHFVLRAVVAILSSQRYGIWKFVSVIPFEGVTESMMWHIVWVFYNNGRDEVDELGGLCPYFSDSYWRAKFNEPAMKFLFREKLPSLSTTESAYLLKSLANMVKSRPSTEAEFIKTISVEMFEMGFLMASKGENNLLLGICTELFVELVIQHPFLVSALVLKIRDSNSFDEQCLELFEKLPLHLWKPEESICLLLGDWLAKSALNTIFNKLSRLIICKLNWGTFPSTEGLFLNVKYHRLIAICIYDALMEQFKLQENIDVVNCIVYQEFTNETLLCYAKSPLRKCFVEFCWRVVMMLKLHATSQPNWSTLSKSSDKDESVDEDENFYPLPNVNMDAMYLSLFKGVELNCPFAIYLTLTMTENGHKESLFEENYAMLLTLMNTKNYVPSLAVISWFLPFYVEKLEKLLADARFITAIQQLLLFDANNIISRAVGVVSSQLSSYSASKKELFVFWVKLLCEVAVTVMKQNSSSWFMDSSRGVDHIVFLLDHTIMFAFFDESFGNTVFDTLIEKSSEMQAMKPPTTSGWLNWGNNSKKSEWVSPLHYLSQKCSQRVWFTWALIKSDAVKFEKIWEGILLEMNRNIDISIEAAIKAVCTRLNVSPVPLNILPLTAWAHLAIEAPIEHVLQPLIWYNFYTNFFASVESGGSFGLRILGDDILKRLKSKLNMLIEWHHKKWMEMANVKGTENEPAFAKVTRLYRAFLLWLEDTHLHDPFVDIERLPRQYSSEHLKCVMNGTEQIFRNLVDEAKADTEMQLFADCWNEVKDLKLEPIVCSRGAFSENADFGEIKPYPAPEFKEMNARFVQLDGSEIMNQQSKTAIAMLQHNMRIILEENKYFENRFRKLSDLSTKLIELLCETYENLQREVQLRIGCDKDGYDPDGCTGPANIVIEFLEATENIQKSKLLERSRFDLYNLLREVMESPNDKIVAQTVYLGKCIPLLGRATSENEDVPQCLLTYFLSSVSDANAVIFPPTKHLFNILVDSLNFDTQERRDSTSQFVLQTTLTQPHTIQFLAPLLVPLQCTAESFLKMYEVLQKSIEATPPHVLFVLLSKFDVNSWLKVASEDECNRFMKILGEALNTLGKNPAKEKLMMLGLYRKHLQYLTICRFPRYVEHIFMMLLNGMSNFRTYPQLWNDVLLSFGFYVQSSRIELNTLVSELKKYADLQPLFSANEIYPLFCCISGHFDAIRHAKFRFNFLHHFHEYVQPFSVLLSALSFMWINVNSRTMAGNFQNVWNPFLECWKPWLFPPDYSDPVESEDFEGIWDIFVANIHYSIGCFHGLSSCILSLLWQVIGKFFLNFKGDMGKNANVIQEKMKILCWKRFVPTEDDIALMHEVSQHEKCPPNLIISHILHSVNWRNCAQFIPYERLPQALERLTYTIISVVNDPSAIVVADIPFGLVSVENTHPICHFLRKKVNLKCYFDSNDELMYMWLCILKAVCCITKGDNANNSEKTIDQKRKTAIFAYSMVGIIEDAINGGEQILTIKPVKTKAFLEGFVGDLVSSDGGDINHRRELFHIFSDLVKMFPDEESQRLVLSLLQDRLKEHPHMALDFLYTTCHDLIETCHVPDTIEYSVSTYAIHKDSRLESLVEAFDVSVDLLTPEFYSQNVQSCAFLSLLLCFEKKRSTTEPINLTVDMIDCCCQMKPIPPTEAKVIGFWFVVVRDATTILAPEESSLPLLKASLRFSRYLLTVTEEVVSQGFLSFIKFTKKLISPRAAFVTLSFAIIVLKRIDEMVTNTHPLYPELHGLIKSSQGKVSAMKKHKAFAELMPLLEKASEFYDEQEILPQVAETLYQWLLAYYSDAVYFKLMTSSITSKK